MDAYRMLYSYLDTLPHARDSRHAASCRLGNGKTLVLFIHGIQGSPSQFDWLIDLLKPDTDFINVLLKGHGSTAADFRSCGRKEWEQQLQGLAHHAAALYQHIIVVGHSMGCLLALKTFRSPPACTVSLILWNAPFAIRPTLRYVRSGFLALSRRPSANPHVRASQQANSLLSRNPLAYLFSIRPYWDLLRLIHDERKSALPCPCPVEAFFCDEDEIVSPRSMAISTSKGFHTQMLAGCSHNHLTSEAQLQIQQTFLRILSQSK